MIEISKIQMAAVAILAALLIWTLYGALVSMNVNEPPYQVVETLENGVEIREYSGQIWAVTSDDDQNRGFSRLFRYISGENEGGVKIEMTAPVVTGAAGGELFIAFIMPEGLNLEDAPSPRDDRVRIEAVKERRMAAIAFSGYATEDKRERYLATLEEALKGRGIEAEGEAFLMQYNDPWTPPFMRRNEVASEVIGV